MFLEFVFWLLLGLLVVGIMYELVFVIFLECYMGNNFVGVIMKVVVIGVFLFLCFCGVIFVVFGLCWSGVFMFLIIFFLVFIFEIGVDSVFVLYVLLGFLYVIVRFIVVIVSVIYVGFMVCLFNYVFVVKVFIYGDGYGYCFFIL